MNFSNLNLNLETIVLLLGSLAFILLLYKWHSDEHVEFDIRHAFVDDKTGKTSLSKFGQFVALAISSWLIINETRQARLTEWLFIGYMVTWAGANSLNKYLKDKQTQPTEGQPPQQ